MGRKLAQEEFIQKVFERNRHVRNGEVEIRGNLINTSERIECICHIHNVIWTPIASSLYKDIGCWQCGHDANLIKPKKTHEEFIAEVGEIDPDVVVHGTYTGAYCTLEFTYKCGHTWATKATHFVNNKHGCPYCSGQRVLVGFNDLWTTAPEAAKLLTNPEGGYKFSRGSGKKVNFTCQLCNGKQDKIISNVVKRGLQCSYCGDGVSYPNKFGRELLRQLQVEEHRPEYQPEWAKPYLYDNYFKYNNTEYFLEMDGKLHYYENNGFGRSLKEVQEIDRIKNELAIVHDIVMIRIDCCESDCDYIKNNILNSDLNNIFDLSVIDWEQCDAHAHKNLVKSACDLYMSGIKSFYEIGKILQVGHGAIVRYIKKGADLGWCDYKPTRPGPRKKNSTVQN